MSSASATDAISWWQTPIRCDTGTPMCFPQRNTWVNIASRCIGFFNRAARVRMTVVSTGSEIACAFRSAKASPGGIPSEMSRYSRGITSQSNARTRANGRDPSLGVV